LVRAPGVEPGRIARRILSPLGLPIPPCSHMVSDERFELPLHGPKPRVLPGYTNRS